LLIYGRAQLNAPTQSGAAVPLRQTWLCKKKGKYVALKVIPNYQTKLVKFEVVETTTEKLWALIHLLAVRGYFYLSSLRHHSQK